VKDVHRAGIDGSEEKPGEGYGHRVAGDRRDEPDEDFEGEGLYGGEGVS
jgi:hypothetical protein